MRSIQGIYIALFGRPADPEGIAYYEDTTNGGADLDAVGALSASPEYIARFADMGPAQQITQIFQDLFSRPVDADGLQFYVDLIPAGGASAQDIAIRILDGARDADRAVVANKIEAADRFTAALDSDEAAEAYQGKTAVEYAQAFLQDVDDSPQSIPNEAETEAFTEALVAGEDPTEPPLPPPPTPDPNASPTLEMEIADQSATQDGEFSFILPDGTFADPDGDTLTVSARLADGGPLPDWLAFDPETGELSGTPTNDDIGGKDASIDIEITASDGRASVTDAFVLTVDNVNDAPTLSVSIADQTATGAEPFSFVIPEGTFSDPDADDSLTYTATMEDESALSDWLDFDAGTGEFSGTPSHVDLGDLDVIVTASDGTENVSDTFSLTIEDGYSTDVYSELRIDVSEFVETYGDEAFDDAVVSYDADPDNLLVEYDGADTMVLSLTGSDREPGFGEITVSDTPDDGPPLSDTINFEFVPNRGPVIKGATIYTVIDGPTTETHTVDVIDPEADKIYLEDISWTGDVAAATYDNSSKELTVTPENAPGGRGLVILELRDEHGTVGSAEFNVTIGVG